MGISLKHVNFSYQKKKQKTPKMVLSDINLDIKSQDEFICIVGHTGSGKSTLVQLFNGLLFALEGEVKVFDTVMKTGINLQDIRKKVGLVFQFPEYQIFEETLLLDCKFGPQNFKLENPDELAKKALAKVKISEELYDASPYSLSGGTLRKVAIAGVLASNPDILVFDEPTVGLDPLSKKELVALLKELNEDDHKTIIVITHDMDLVAEVSKRVVVLNEGQIVFDDAKDALFKNQELIQKYHLDYPSTIKLMQKINEKLNLNLDIYQYNLLDIYNILRKLGDFDE